MRVLIDELLSMEYNKCLAGLSAICLDAWNTAAKTTDGRVRIQALALVKDCYTSRWDHLTNASLLDSAIQYLGYSKSELIQIAEEEEEDRRHKEVEVEEEKEQQQLQPYH
jgi:hypothetical protein